MSTVAPAAVAQPQPRLDAWIFTFGYDHRHPVTDAPLRDRYVRIEAETYAQAREKMNASFGNRWAFQYSFTNGEDMAKRYELQPIAYLTPEQITEERLLRRIGEFVNVTSRPLFNFRMADAMCDSSVREVMRRSAHTRRRNAARELDELIREYVAQHPDA